MTTLVARRSQFHQQVLGDKITASSAMGQQAFARLTPFLAQQGFDRVTAAHKAGGLVYRLLGQQAALSAMRTPFISWGFSSWPTSRWCC